MNSQLLTEIESLEHAFERDEDFMQSTNYLSAFRATPEGRAFVAAHLTHMDKRYERYEVLVREASRVDQ